MKKCNICLETKEFEFFVKRSNRKNGFQPYCKECHNKRMRGSYRSDKMKNYDLMKNYGISLDDFIKMSEKQNNCCAICNINVNKLNKTKKKTLCVDHCHNTGLVRGLLCDKCNRGIGLLNEDIETLKNAIKYLT